MRRNSIIILISILAFVSCNTQHDVIKGQFKNESYTYYQEKKNSDYLTIFVPDVQQSLLDKELSIKSAKGTGCFIPFLSEHDHLRQLQLDNLSNRKDYYSEILQQITRDSTKQITVVAEGLNANLISQIAFAFPIEHLILLNPYKPTIEQLFISKCINESNGYSCDSLLDQFRLRDRAQIIELVDNINNGGVDQQIGIYPLPVWKAVLTYTCAPRENRFTGKLSYIYTINSGLAPLQDSLSVVTNKDLYKRMKETINN